MKCIFADFFIKLLLKPMNITGYIRRQNALVSANFASCRRNGTEEFRSVHSDNFGCRTCEKDFFINGISWRQRRQISDYRESMTR